MHSLNNQLSTSKWALLEHSTLVDIWKREKNSKDSPSPRSYCEVEVFISYKCNQLWSMENYSTEWGHKEERSNQLLGLVLPLVLFVQAHLDFIFPNWFPTDFPPSTPSCFTSPVVSSILTSHKLKCMLPFSETSTGENGFQVAAHLCLGWQDLGRFLCYRWPVSPWITAAWPLSLFHPWVGERGGKHLESREIKDR
jgi:hypothetical protein